MWYGVTQVEKRQLRPRLKIQIFPVGGKKNRFLFQHITIPSALSAIVWASRKPVKNARNLSRFSLLLFTGSPLLIKVFIEEVQPLVLLASFIKKNDTCVQFGPIAYPMRGTFRIKPLFEGLSNGTEMPPETVIVENVRQE